MQRLAQKAGTRRKRPRSSMQSVASSSEEVREACRATIEDYASVAEGYARGNMDHDVSQNMEALLKPLAGLPKPLDILDVCSASGRDLLAFTKLGHRAVGLDGVPAFCSMSRELSGCEVWQQDLSALDLPEGRFDGIFCNACLFHLPRAALPSTLASLRRTLRPHGVLFVSNAHGFGEDREGWTSGRTAGTRSYVCWLSEETWLRTCDEAGLELIEKFYRPPGRPRSQQPFLATVWRKRRPRPLPPFVEATIEAVPVAALHEGRELVMVVLHDRAGGRLLLRLPNALGWRLHFGCAGGATLGEARPKAREALKQLGIEAPALRQAGLMLFSFPEHAPLRVRVLEAAAPTEVPEGGQWCAVGDLPFGEMWADDKIWMPAMLAGEKSYFEAHFVFDGPPGPASKLLEHNWDPGCPLPDEEL